MTAPARSSIGSFAALCWGRVRARARATLVTGGQARSCPVAIAMTRSVAKRHGERSSPQRSCDALIWGRATSRRARANETLISRGISR